MEKHLTDPYDPILSGQIRQTVQGMAFWAGSGPDGATCEDCAFYGYWYPGFRDGKPIRKRRAHGCGKFKRMTGKHGSAIPGRTEACKYFEEKPRA